MTTERSFEPSLLGMCLEIPRAVSTRKQFRKVRISRGSDGLAKLKVLRAYSGALSFSFGAPGRLRCNSVCKKKKPGESHRALSRQGLRDRFRAATGAPFEVKVLCWGDRVSRRGPVESFCAQTRARVGTPDLQGA